VSVLPTAFLVNKKDRGLFGVAHDLFVISDFRVRAGYPAGMARHHHEQRLIFVC
jgi:hypothetical protein